MIHLVPPAVVCNNNEACESFTLLSTFSACPKYNQFKSAVTAVALAVHAFTKTFIFASSKNQTPPLIALAQFRIFVYVVKKNI